MKRDKGLWVIIALFVLTLCVIGFEERRFTANNKFADPQLAPEVISRQEEVLEATRKFAMFMAENETGFLELRVAKFIGGSTSTVCGASLIAFIYLGVRQQRLMKRIEQLEMERKVEFTR